MNIPANPIEIPPQAIFDRTNEFKANFSSESDRACVVLIAARLDELLHQALSAYLLPPPTRDDNLLDSDRALGTFSARIDASYRLGFMDSESCRALHLLRRVRNEFAHETSDSSLEKSPHRERIHQLAAPLAHIPQFQQLISQEFSAHPNCRAVFSACALTLVTRMERMLYETRRINAVPITLVSGSWLKPPSQAPELMPTSITPPAKQPKGPTETGSRLNS